MPFGVLPSLSTQTLHKTSASRSRRHQLSVNQMLTPLKALSTCTEMAWLLVCPSNQTTNFLSLKAIFSPVLSPQRFADKHIIPKREMMALLADADMTSVEWMEDWLHRQLREASLLSLMETWKTPWLHQVANYDSSFKMAPPTSSYSHSFEVDLCRLQPPRMIFFLTLSAKFWDMFLSCGLYATANCPLDISLILSLLFYISQSSYLQGFMAFVKTEILTGYSI